MEIAPPRRAPTLAPRRVAPAPLRALGLALALLAAGREVEGASGPCASLDVSALFPTGSGGGSSSSSPDIGAMMVGGPMMMGAPQLSPQLSPLPPPPFAKASRPPPPTPPPPRGGS